MLLPPFQPRRPFPATPAALRNRLIPVALSLIAAQLGYVLLALNQLRSGFEYSGNGPPQTPFTIGAVVVGLLSLMASFPIAARRFRQQASAADYPTAAPALQQQFFIGFAFSTVASLAGLLVFFIYADIKPLVFLVSLGSAGIALHYVRVHNALKYIERAHR